VNSEFKSLRDILRESREAHIPQTPAISPLIPQTPAAPQAEYDRLAPARFAERLDRALERLLVEIAAEVVGRELLLAPVEIAAIVERLAERYGLSGDAAVYAGDGDVTIGEVDASLGRRIRAAIDRALR
jgi:hypothetical protein